MACSAADAVLDVDRVTRDVFRRGCEGPSADRSAGEAEILQVDEQHLGRGPVTAADAMITARATDTSAGEFRAITFILQGDKEISFGGRISMPHKHPVEPDLKNILKKRHRFIGFLVVRKIMKSCRLIRLARQAVGKLRHHNALRQTTGGECHCRHDAGKSLHESRQNALLRTAIALILAAAAPFVHTLSPGGDDWLALERDDLVLYTDLTRDRALELADHLVRFRAALDVFPWGNIGARSAMLPPLEVLAFKRRQDFSRLMKPSHFAAFAQPGLRSTLLVIAPASSEKSLLRNARHEYVHYHLRTYMTGFPLWFDEGMSVMLEHLTLDRDTSLARLDTAGLFNHYRGKVRDPEGPSLSVLLETTRTDRWSYNKLRRFYGLMGQFAHFLYFDQRRDLKAKLENFLRQRQLSLAQMLGSSHRKLSTDFARHRRDKVSPLVFAYEVPAYSMTIRSLKRADVTRIQARAAEDINPQRARELLSEIVRNEQGNTAALIDLARLEMLEKDFAASERTLQRVQALKGDTTAQYFIQRALLVTNKCDKNTLRECSQDWGSASAYVRKALELDENRVDGVYLKGIIDLYRGQPGVAVNYLRAAHRYAPWAPKINYHLGECLRLLGDPSALFYLENAFAWSKNDSWRNLASVSLTLLKQGL